MTPVRTAMVSHFTLRIGHIVSRRGNPIADTYNGRGRIRPPERHATPLWLPGAARIARRNCFGHGGGGQHACDW